MADLYWKGTAEAVAQVATGSIDSVDATPANNTFTVTIGGIAVSVVGDTDVATTATNLRAALNASTHPYFAAITWSGTSGDIIGTADNPGMPFVAALTETGAGTGTVTDFAATTASSGPYDWSTAANWSTGSVPVSTDDVYIDVPDAKILYGLDQNSVTLGELHIRQNAIVGLRSANFATDAASTTYSTAAVEYRDDYLRIKAGTVRIGEHLGPGQPTGSTRLKLDNTNTAANTTTIFTSGQTAAETELPAIRLLYSDADSDLYIRQNAGRGGVGIAVDTPGETSTVGEIYISDPSNVSRFFMGDGVTASKFSAVGGISVLNISTAALATLECDGVATITVEGSNVVTAATVEAGRLVLNNLSGTNIAATTLTQNGGEVDMQQSSEPRTISTYNFNEGVRRIDDHVTITADNRSGRIVETVVV